MGNTVVDDGGSVEWDIWNDGNKLMADAFFKTLDGGGRRFVNSEADGGRRPIGLIMAEVLD